MATIQSAFYNSINKHNLVKPDQKILLAVSGGIDSLIMTILFNEYNKALNNSLDLQAVYIKIQQVTIEDQRINQIQKYLHEWNIPFQIINGSVSDDVKFRCYACAKERRKQLCIYSDKNNFDAISLGHILDDYLETGLMNMIFHGQLESIKPKDTMFNGTITILRPLLPIYKSKIIQYADSIKIELSKHDCMFEENNKRNEIRKMIKQLSILNKGYKSNLRKIINKWNNYEI